MGFCLKDLIFWICGIYRSSGDGQNRTLTKGVFKVQKSSCMDIQTDLIKYTATLETKSTILLELLLSNMRVQKKTVTDVEEIAGHGLKGKVDGKEILAGM
jgi:Cd2+/Zn2+-exporting ATPase